MLQGRTIAHLFDGRSAAFQALFAREPRACCSTSAGSCSTRARCELLLDARGADRGAALDRAHVRGSPDQQHRGSPRAARRASSSRRSAAARLRRGRDAAGRDRARARCASSRTRCTRASFAATPGDPITDVVNIGIGGSDLGIVMAVTALAEQRPKSGSACTSCRTSTAWRCSTCSTPSIPRRRCS